MTDLKPCPFCGGAADSDWHRSYLQIDNGQYGSAVAVYCSQCAADMSHCIEDNRGTPREDLMADLVKRWNTRADENNDTRGT